MWSGRSFRRQPAADTSPGVTDPWELAQAAAGTAGVKLRALTSVDDGDAVARVIAATWGGQHLDREVIKALGVSGNAVWGAEAEGEVVGFVLGWAGVDDDGLHVHSHMLASLPDRRHRGVGYALKLAQRAQALDQGIDVVRWTFDPMVARNAWFNAGKLGTVSDRFVRDFYGVMTDALNAGDRTDRLVTRWDLGREPGPRELPSDAPVVAVPADHHGSRGADPEVARRQRDEVAASIEALMADGYVVAGFDRDRSAHVFVARESVS